MKKNIKIDKNKTVSKQLVGKSNSSYNVFRHTEDWIDLLDPFEAQQR